MKKKKITVAAAIAVPTLTLATGSIPFEAIADVDALVKSESNKIEPTAKDAKTLATISDKELEGVIKQVLGISEDADLTVADMYGLTELELTDMSIQLTSLEGLEQAVNLTKFTLFGQEHLDLTPLHSLTGLKSLNIIGRSSVSFDELIPFVGIEELTLEGVYLDDVTELSMFNQLKRLNLSGNHIDDATPLAGLTSLEELNLSNNPISTIPSLSGLTQLQSLDLSITNIKDLTPVSSLSTLKELNIANTEVSSLEPIQSLTMLKEIVFNNTKVISINPLAKLTQLEKVVGGGNFINDFRAVAHVDDISFEDIYLEKTIDLTSPYISLPIYLPSGERMPLSSSYGIWDEEQQGFKLTQAPVDGDVITLEFNEGGKISGNVELTLNVKEVATPVILTNQVTGEVVIKNITEGNTVYYRDTHDGQWKEYKGPFKPSVVNKIDGQAYYYVEAKQTNGLIESPVAVTEFSRDVEMSAVESKFNWWQNGKATMTLSHEDEGAEIYYRLGDGDWKLYKDELNLTSTYKEGKIEMQFYARLADGESEVTDFSILKTPEITGVKNDDKIQITHPLPKVNIYYRVNGGEWMTYTGAFGFEEEGEYLIETYAEEAGVESPVSVPVTVKTYSTDGTADSDSTTNNGGNGSSTNTGSNSNTNTGTNSGTNTNTNSGSNSNSDMNSNTNSDTNSNINSNTNSNTDSTTENGELNSENNNQEVNDELDDENPVTGVSSLAVLAGATLLVAGAMILLENENKKKARV